jgi:two-component system sensor histidine kinase AtoS
MNPAPSRMLLEGVLRGRSTNLPELNALVQLLPEPSILIYGEKFDVAAVNSAYLQLTAFSLSDIRGKSVTDLFEVGRRIAFKPGMEAVMPVARHKKISLPMRVKATALGIDSPWLLLTLLEPGEDIQERQRQMDSLFKAIIELMRLDDSRELSEVLDEIMRITRSVVGSDLICMYQAESGKPELTKVKTYESSVAFPSMLPSTDLIRLSEPFIWSPGKRMLTELHRAGRMDNLSYIATAPIGEKDALFGLLVVSDPTHQPGEFTLEALQIIASFITRLVQHQMLIENLKEDIQTKMNWLNIRSSGLENVQEGVILLDLDLKIIEINPAAEWMFGYANWEVKNVSVENILIGSERILPSLSTAAQGVASHNISNLSLNRRNGQSFPAQMRVIPVQKNEQVLAVLVFISDISEHEEIKARTQQLEHRAVLGDFANVFAHEVRNPINNISTGVQLIASRLPQDDPNQEVLTRVQGDCLRLDALMESVLAFSRPLPKQVEPVDLNDLLKKIMDRWYPRMTKVNVKPIFQENPEMPKIMGNWRSLEQVFTNLISNAVEAMEKTGGTLAIKINQIKIAERQHVEISISDTGPGIPEEIRKRLFEPFVTNKSGGTGLGLAITKRIVIAHRGNIDVSSVPGGTIFKVTLPVTDGD